DEDPRPDVQRQPAEGGAAGEVLQRHPGRPLGQEVAEARDPLLGELPTEDEAALELTPPDAEHVRDQRHGVRAGGGDPCLGEGCHGLPHQRAKGVHPSSPARAASLAASSAATAESMTGSSAPSRTASSWWAL